MQKVFSKKNGVTIEAQDLDRNCVFILYILLMQYFLTKMEAWILKAEYESWVWHTEYGTEYDTIVW